MPLPTLPHCWCGCLPLPSLHMLSHSAWTPQRPKTCRLASHTHIKPGELENILLARELEELLEPRATDWSQALGLTTLHPGFFLFLCESLSSDVVPTVYVLLFWFGLFIFEAWMKEPSSSTVPCAENCSIFSLSSCASPFSSSSLVPATFALLV